MGLKLGGLLGIGSDGYIREIAANEATPALTLTQSGTGLGLRVDGPGYTAGQDHRIAEFRRVLFRS